MQKPKWKELESTVGQPNSFLGTSTINSQYPNSSMRNVTKIKDSNVHNRLYNEHVAHAQRRSSIYDPERKDKEDENFNCTFQPCLEKT